MDVDLAVVGAGPAGLTLAWKAAEQGLNVIIIDKKKSASHAAYLTSGSFINIKEWDIPENIVQPIDSLYLSSLHSSFTTRQKQDYAHIINRRKLLEYLAQQAEKHGVKLLFNTYVNHVAINKNIKKIIINTGETITAKVFADCSGLGRVLEKHFNLVPEKQVISALGVEYLVPLKAAKNTIDLYIGSHYDGGYGWLFPMDDHTAILGYGTFRKKNFPKAKEFLDKMFEFPRINDRVKRTILEMNSGIFRTGKPLKRFHHNNLVLVGDVCLQGNPVVGEGIRFVMDAARMAADAVVAAVQSNDMKKLDQYTKLWNAAYYKKYRAGFWLQRLLNKTTGHDKLADRAVIRASKAREETLRQVLSGDITYSYILKKTLKIARDIIS